VKILAVFLMAVLIAGCSQGMHDNSRTKPLEENSFFANGESALMPVAGTVARGKLRLDDHFYRGKSNDAFATAFPFAITPQTLQRGRERFEIFCAPCHDRTGEGNGIVVQRGFKKPAPLADARLVNAPVGYHFDVITHGYQTMHPMADQVGVTDRWAIVAYVRVLQRASAGISNNASLPASLSPQRGEGLRVRGYADETPSQFRTAANVSTPHPDPLPVEGRGRTAFIARDKSDTTP